MEGLRVAMPPPHSYHAYYKYYAFVRPEQLHPGWDRDRIMQAIARRDSVLSRQLQRNLQGESIRAGTAQESPACPWRKNWAKQA